MKKLLIIFLIVLAIIAIGLTVREVMIHSDGKLDKSNPMTREEIVALLDKGATYNNYYYCPSGPEDETKTEYYIKDNVKVTYHNSQMIEWCDYNNSEKIWFVGPKGTATIIGETTKFEYNQYGFDYSTMSKPELYNNEYEYLGEKEENGRTIIIVKLKTTNGLLKGVDKYYIDKETGLILGRFNSTKLLFITTYASGGSNNRNVKMDIVTDEDVKRPDLTGYEIIDNREK